MIAAIRQHRSEIEALCQRFGVQRLELFGSAVADGFRAGSSDLDFLVEFENAGSPGYSDRYFGLLEALTDLFNRPVDLVVASAIKNPYFRQSIEQTKVPLYAG